MKCTYENPTSVENKWPQSQFRAVDVNALTVIGTWLQPGEESNELIARKYSTVRMDRRNGQIGGVTVVPVAEK